MTIYKHTFHLILLLLLTACSSAPPIATNSLPFTKEHLASGTPTIEKLLSAANNSSTNEDRYKLLLQAADLMQVQKNYSQSETVLTAINFSSLTKELKEQYLLLSLEGAWKTNNISRQAVLLKLIKKHYFENAPPDIQKNAFSLIADAYARTNQPLKAAIERINAAALFPGDQYLQNNNFIWQLLNKTSTFKISQILEKPLSPDVKGWLELAVAIKQNQLSLDQQVIALKRWQKKWPQHPAALKLPNELQLLSELPDRRPGKIALALPLSGKFGTAGKAVLNGFLAAFYADSFRTTHHTAIDIFDTNRESIPTLVKKINQSRADLIVGPLQKLVLQKILQNPESIKVPVLALNYLDQPHAPFPVKVYQFGLSPDDEINQIIHKLRKKGVRKIATILPENKWGEKIYQYIQTSWSNKNGILIYSAFYNNQKSLSKMVANLLSITQSKRREYRIKRLLSSSIKFNPRRRRDIGAIILAASPEQARQIKPLLSFYFAENIPVYAFSKIYSGTPLPEKDSDLDGIYFTDTPWSLSNTNQLKYLLNKNLPNLSRHLSDLMALGVDAYRLSSRLELLEKIKGSSVQSEDGTLTLGPMRIIHRKLDWARFVSGKPQILD